MGKGIGFWDVVWMMQVSYGPVAGCFFFDFDLLMYRGPIGIGAGIKEDVVPVVVYEFNRFGSGSLVDIISGSEGGINPKGFSF
jgi:hypothetical protein